MPKTCRWALGGSLGNIKLPLVDKHLCPHSLNLVYTSRDNRAQSPRWASERDWYVKSLPCLESFSEQNLGAPSSLPRKAPSFIPQKTRVERRDQGDKRRVPFCFSIIPRVLWLFMRRPSNTFWGHLLWETRVWFSDDTAVRSQNAYKHKLWLCFLPLPSW